MKTHTHSVPGIIDAGDLQTFHMIRQALGRIDLDVDFGIRDDGMPVILSSHILARAVGQTWSIPVVDGSHLVTGQAHSWLSIGDGVIIDVYPIGMVGGPVLVYSPALQSLYVERPSSASRSFKEPWFARAVERIKLGIAYSSRT